LLAYGQWFSPGTPASSTTQTGHHDIAEILLKVALNTKNQSIVPGFVNYKKGYTQLTVASDKVNQLLAHGRWFSQGTPASSTTKTGRHNIAEIFLEKVLKTQ